MLSLNPIRAAQATYNILSAGCQLICTITSVALTRLAFLRTCIKLSLVKVGCPFFGRYYDQITPNVILGAVPLTALGMRGELDRLGVTKTLTFLEDWEKRGCGIFNVYRPLDDDNHLHIEAQDHVALSVQQIREGVNFIKEAADRRERIYVHCKAGNGRSGTCVAAYLALTIRNAEPNGSSRTNAECVDEACRRLKAIRPGVTLKPERKERITSFLEATPKSE